MPDVQSLEQTKAGIRFKDTKKSRNRSVVLPAFAVDELRRLKKQQAAIGARNFAVEGYPGLLPC
jgi:hypothetical protein